MMHTVNTQVVPILCWIHVEPEALLLVLLSQHQRHSQQTDFTKMLQKSVSTD